MNELNECISSAWILDSRTLGHRYGLRMISVLFQHLVRKPLSASRDDTAGSKSKDAVVFDGSSAILPNVGAYG